MGLIMNGFLKVPMQFFILLIGIMVFVFYQYNHSPLNFNPSAVKDVMASEYAAEYSTLETEKNQLQDQIRTLQLSYAASKDHPEKTVLVQELTELNTQEDSLRQSAKTLIKKANPNAETNDRDYVFIHFILTQLPKGLIGLLLAVILSAAMSSTASELNALGSTTAIDLYRRNTPGQTEHHYVKASRWFTLLWGLMAIGVACTANLFDNLIQLVNIIGSLFYGNILGVFLLAFFFKGIRATPVFIAAIINQFLIISMYFMDKYEIINLPYLWLNFVGCATVIGIAYLVQVFMRKEATS